ncbi:MAG: hypothetical protein Q9191_007856, partial [Dirinaria sp. TL-2023a]
MVIVAIAGGTGGVGRTVLDAIMEAGQHQAIVLSRTAAAATATDGARRLAVDYSDIEQIKHILQENNVEVVVSALLLADEIASKSQINLIRAAAQSGTVTKFIPSEYYIDFHAPIPGSDLFTDFNLEAEAELSRHPQLTWTLIRAGIFLDSLTAPHNPLKTYIDPFWVFVDIDPEQCVFPGDGSYPLVLTHSIDLGAYIERLIGLPSKDWPRESLVASNRLQVKDLETLIKKATGKQPNIGTPFPPQKAYFQLLIQMAGKDFHVTYDPVKSIREGHITPLPSNQPVFDDPDKGELFRQVERQVVLSMLSHAHELPGKDLAEIFPE